MAKSSVTHSTFIIERNYAASAGTVFAAWSDPAQKRRWYAEGERGSVEEHQLDFRVGGGEHTKTVIGGGPFQGTSLTNDSVYLDIVPNQRIVFAYTMTLGEKRISASQATVEFLPDGKGTIMAFTEQGAFFEGADGPDMREQGWKSLLGQLEKFLAHSR
jgi:uncharacterized protein YndB with AHSA1/START domain